MKIEGDSLEKKYLKDIKKQKKIKLIFHLYYNIIIQEVKEGC